MNPTLQRFTREHQEASIQLAAFETRLDSSLDLADFLAYIEGDLAEHFMLEEEALFPALSRFPLVARGTLAVMNAERESLRLLLRRLGKAVRTNNRSEQQTFANDIIVLLREHMLKEDKVLLPLADRLLKSEDLDRIDEHVAGTLGLPPV